MPGSCFAKGSDEWIYNTATSMVMINGTTASLVPNPKRINTEQITSANTVNVNDSSPLMPSTAGN